MEHVVRGKLKLKTGGLKVVGKDDKKKKLKKKAKKDKKRQREEAAREDDGREEEEEEVVVLNDMTPAQRRYEEHRRKREEAEVQKVAEKTYRQRVEELNQYLGRLTEHHDIPRVSAAGNG
ncbi:hypothetical protein P43SY_003083 [Pythium insidiosum]|uniref:FAM32A-like protein n=1 Tax=Pythium insidiosum TaxID=114742 RepID=A0AAD5QA62_PYTIN|nr:hypothetical protein P43SY_003083 [Pythium insidiosum]